MAGALARTGGLRNADAEPRRRKGPVATEAAAGAMPPQVRAPGATGSWLGRGGPLPGASGGSTALPAPRRCRSGLPSSERVNSCCFQPVCVTAAAGNECTYCAPGAAPPGIQPSIRTNVEQPPCVRRSPRCRAGADGPCPPVPRAARVCAVAGWLGARVGQPCPLCGARSSSVMSTHTRV